MFDIFRAPFILLGLVSLTRFHIVVSHLKWADFWTAHEKEWNYSIVTLKFFMKQAAFNFVGMYSCVFFTQKNVFNPTLYQRIELLFLILSLPSACIPTRTVGYIGAVTDMKAELKG